MFSPFSNTFVCPSQLVEMVNCHHSTLSHHMKILVDAKIVNARKEGKWMHYSLSDEGITLLQEYLSDLTSHF